MTSHSHISFRHPGYPDNGDLNVLLRLPTIDSRNQQHRSPKGVYYDTALVACALIAGNSWDGFFTRTRRSGPIIMGPKDLLLRKSYYFNVPAEGPQYPVYPSLAHWHYSQDYMPQTWKAMKAPPPPQDAWSHHRCPLYKHPPPQESVTDEETPYEKDPVLDGDKAEIREAIQAMLQLPHINPRSFSDALSVRALLHRAFREGSFVFVPTNVLGFFVYKNEWRVNFLDRDHTLRKLFHGFSVEMPPLVSVQFLFKKFAASIFPLLRSFLDGGRRQVRLRHLECDEYDELVILGGKEVISRQKRKAGPVDDLETHRTKRRCVSGFGASVSEPDFLPCKIIRRKLSVPEEVWHIRSPWSDCVCDLQDSDDEPQGVAAPQATHNPYANRLIDLRDEAEEEQPRSSSQPDPSSRKLSDANAPSRSLTISSFSSSDKITVSPDNPG
ncbi:hypothetical protein MMC31_007816 [Peltigera leucophlebia]|nr:hypothetical protein [Peltigera leucophlebia]